MRTVLVTLALTALTLQPTAASPDVGGPAREPIYLDGPAALAELRSTNPDHYARAERIFAAASRLCREGAAQLQYAVADARDFSCGMLLKTSNPPKRQISFRLDDTRYVALVTLSDEAPKLIPAAGAPR